MDEAWCKDRTINLWDVGGDEEHRAEHWDLNTEHPVKSVLYVFNVSRIFMDQERHMDEQFMIFRSTMHSLRCIKKETAMVILLNKIDLLEENLKHPNNEKRKRAIIGLTVDDVVDFVRRTIQTDLYDIGKELRRRGSERGNYRIFQRDDSYKMNYASIIRSVCIDRKLMKKITKRMIRGRLEQNVQGEFDFD